MNHLFIVNLLHSASRIAITMNAPPVQYVRTSDSYDIAYTVSGEGPPYVYMPHLAHHVRLSWGVPERAAWLQGLASRFTLICYDSRGQGLSTRGLASGFSISDLVRDLETVVQHLELRDFVLDAQLIFGHVALRFAAAHPLWAPSPHPQTLRARDSGELEYPERACPRGLAALQRPRLRHPRWRSQSDGRVLTSDGHAGRLANLLPRHRRLANRRIPARFESPDTLAAPARVHGPQGGGSRPPCRPHRQCPSCNHRRSVPHHRRYAGFAGHRCLSERRTSQHRGTLGVPRRHRLPFCPRTGVLSLLAVGKSNQQIADEL